MLLALYRLHLITRYRKGESPQQRASARSHWTKVSKEGEVSCREYLHRKQADKDKTLPEGTIFQMDQQIHREGEGVLLLPLAPEYSLQKGEAFPSPPGYTRIPATGKLRLFLVFPVAPEYPLRES